MGKFVRKDIKKTPNSFFYTPKRFISKGKVFFSALSIAVDAGGSFSPPVKDQDFIPAQHKEMLKCIAELA